MADTPISRLPEASDYEGSEITVISQLSTVVRISAATISAQASDQSFNDSGNGFLTAGFTVGDYVNITGFTGDVANNIYSGEITDLTAGKMTIGGSDGGVIVDDAAGETVVIAKWTSRRSPAGGGLKIPPSLAAFTQVLGTPVTKAIDGRGIRFTNDGSTTVRIHGLLRPVPAMANFTLDAIFEDSFPRRDGNGIALAALSTTGQLFLSGQFLNSNSNRQETQVWGSSTSRSSVTGSIISGNRIAATLQYTYGTNTYYGGAVDVDFLDLSNAERNNLGYTNNSIGGLAAYAGIVYVQFGNLVGAGMIQSYRDWDFSFDFRTKARD